MPAFSFEKLSPPAPGAAATPTPKESTRKSDRTASEATTKPRGVIVQVLDRIAEARARRSRK